MTETVAASVETHGTPQGLRVERVWTTPGVHPYDEVTWQRRDVVQTNWRTGETIFEQHGVEFPDSWSVNASTIVTTKYFRGAVGAPDREWSLKQLLDRVVLTYTRAGREHGYFASDDDAMMFEHELTWMLLHQVFSFNSPVWFNVGTPARAQVSACFILSVNDTMESILNWYREEGLIFKGGSGSGINLSRIRSSKELLHSGGTASGPVSFMRGADASAGTIKSGGATRRAAKMVVLDVDHPDIAEFVETKAREEDKIRVLRDAGFDMDLGGRDIASVQYQNANNSVRVTDEFMRAVEAGESFGLRARTSGEVVETIDAQELWQSIAQAAWACADPGIQYDGTINDWHTTPESGRINASNPCFPADQRVVTDKGLVKIGDLVSRAAEGETFAVYTNDVTSEADPVARVVATRPLQYMVTGTNPIVSLEFSDGSTLRCTPKHRLWTENRGYVRAEDLTETDEVVRSFHEATRPAAGLALPEAAVAAARAVRGWSVSLPSKWSEDLGHYLGWLVGDGCLTDAGAVTVYGAGDIDEVLPRHREFLDQTMGFEATPSLQANGTVQMRAMRAQWRTLLAGLGVSSGRSAEKVVPEAVFEAPDDTLRAFLRGLFDADGCVVDQKAKGTRYVGLGSQSKRLLQGVQELLASLGVAARIYETGTKTDSFSYTTVGGEERHYGSDGPSYDLRISGPSLARFAERVGFTIAREQDRLEALLAEHSFYAVRETVRMRSRVDDGFETTYNLTEPRNHSYIVNGVVVANCSEYMHLDNSSCNLASLNLMRFLHDDGSFDADRFAKSVELVITAMDISICFADFPTEAIGDTTRKFRQLGIGYANLGALLMASGLAYDSEGGQALAASITSLMTGTAYKRSAELAGVVGPYEGYARNVEPHKRVMRKHAEANAQIPSMHPLDIAVKDKAAAAWEACLSIGEAKGWRNAQASVLAPTGCLTGDTLVTTNRGLARLSELGDVWGDRWQGLDLEVSTDDGPRRATQFFVNGEEPTRRVVTAGGYRIQGTLAHRVKVIDRETGGWLWRRLADVAPGDLVPIQLGTMVGSPRRVPLPVLDQAYYAGDRYVAVPDSLDEGLAELAGYFMGDGSLHAKGIRFCVANTDLDVVERLRVLGKDLFNLEAVVTSQKGYQEVTLQSVRLARWWQAAGLAKDLPGVDHSGKGWTPRVPAVIRESNDPAIYRAFIRGVFEADGTVLEGVPSVSTASQLFGDDLRTLLLAVGLPTTTRETTSGWGGPQFQVRVRNRDHAMRFGRDIGFLSHRKAGLVATDLGPQAGNRDRIVLAGDEWLSIVPVGHPLRGLVQQAVAPGVGLSRRLAEQVLAATGDARVADALGYLYEEVQVNEDGGLQPTYDLSVPDNVTYVASGFVSHNTIGFMMDCDTTGIEPDFSLVKFKKLVGGGSMQIVNQTIPRALRKFGYSEETIEAIVAYIAEHGHVEDAPGLRPEHYEVFDCAVGRRSISAMGHVRMMAAVQPFLSGAISKTVNMPEEATVADVAEVYLEGWKSGLKALAIYRDNCKVGQPLSTGSSRKADKAAEAAAEVSAEAAIEAAPVTPEPEVRIEYRPIRKRLPKKRPATTTSFTVGGAQGYMISSSYPDDGLGELFLKMAKQGSTLAGVMDAFSIAVSIGMQYGVPLQTYVEKFTNMRFEPAGITDDPDVRMTSSIVDYVFRRLALDYLDFDTRSALGIHSADERQRQLETGSYLPSEDEQSGGYDLGDGDLPAAGATGPEAPAAVAPVAPAPQPAPESPAPAPERLTTEAPGAVAAARPVSPEVHSSAELVESLQGRTADSPMCLTCGVKMRPAGSCYVCEGCGSTSGCS